MNLFIPYRDGSCKPSGVRNTPAGKNLLIAAHI